MVGGFDILGRIPGMELGPGVESPLGVGVLDFRPGVPALSRCSEEGEMQEQVRGRANATADGSVWVLPVASLWT